MIAISLYLAGVLFSLFIFIDNSCNNTSYWSTTLQATIITMTCPRVVFVWLRSIKIGLKRLSTSVVSGTRGKRLISFNIFIKIISPKEPKSPSILTVHVFNECYRLTSSLSFDIDHFFNSFFLVV